MTNGNVFLRFQRLHEVYLKFFIKTQPLKIEINKNYISDFWLGQQILKCFLSNTPVARRHSDLIYSYKQQLKFTRTVELWNRWRQLSKYRTLLISFSFFYIKWGGIYLLIILSYFCLIKYSILMKIDFPNKISLHFWDMLTKR